MDRNSAHRLLATCFDAGLAAVEPEQAVRRHLADLELPGRPVLLALGKAAPAMARGAATALGLSRVEGVVVSNHVDEVPDGLELVLGDHPVPGPQSVAAGTALLQAAQALQPDQVAVVLISGGGSALAVSPLPGLSLDDIAQVNTALLRSGADIAQVNTVRRRLSGFKGGGLARAISPADMVVLAVSDVVGDDPATIASGPTVPAGDSPQAAGEIVDLLGIRDQLPSSVLATLAGDPLPRAQTAAEVKIVASGPVAAHAAAAKAEQLGFPAQVVDTRLVGDATEAAGEALQRSGASVSVFAGETTVQVTGAGSGGRNQEAALVAATIIEGDPDVFFLAAGTDGIDGTTNAAGAIVDGTTLHRARAKGLGAADHLDRNDSGSFFAGLDDQLITGPTGTNVGDLWLVLRARRTISS